MARFSRIARIDEVDRSLMRIVRETGTSRSPLAAFDVRPLMAPNGCQGRSRLDNSVRIMRHASAIDNRRGVKPADNVQASANHKRMTWLILQSMLTRETCV